MCPLDMNARDGMNTESGYQEGHVFPVNPKSAEAHVFLDEP